MKVGIIAELLRRPLVESIAHAEKIGAQGIQLRATHAAPGEINLTSCSDAELRAFKKLCDDHHLVISSVCGDLGGVPFQVPAEYPERLKLMYRIIENTVKLGAKSITTHVGCIPADSNDPVYPIMLDSVGAMAQYAEKTGAVLAIETGPEMADTLKKFILDIGGKGIGVNLDPANLRMVSCEDPVYAVKVLAPWIVHTHAKDGVNLVRGSAAKAYGMRNPDGTRREIAEPAAEYKEVPLGQGQVPWDEYLKALKNAGYTGFLTVEREVGDNPAADIEMAVNFLKAKLGAL